MSTRILVVEDLGSSAFIIAARMRQIVEGCDVEIARDLDSASKLLAEKTFDLICLDLGLPDAKDGLHTFNTIQILALRTPIIVITIIDDPVVRNEVEDAGCFKYLVKEQFTQSELSDAVLTALGKANMKEKITYCPLKEEPNEKKTPDPIRFLKRLAAGVAAIMALGAVAASGGDTRWQTRAEAKAERAQMLVTMEYYYDLQRKDTLEDSVYRLQETPVLTHTQKALLDRNLRKLADINMRWPTPPIGVRQP